MPINKEESKETLEIRTIEVETEMEEEEEDSSIETRIKDIIRNKGSEKIIKNRETLICKSKEKGSIMPIVRGERMTGMKKTILGGILIGMIAMMKTHITKEEEMVNRVENMKR